MLDTITETYTAENGMHYEIKMDKVWLNAEVTCIETGKKHPVSYGYDDEDLECAMFDARDWCEWHSQNPVMWSGLATIS